MCKTKLSPAQYRRAIDNEQLTMIVNYRGCGSVRLFIAITLPRQVQQQLAAYAASLAALARGARPTRRENFHLTLAFLGEALTLAQACAALDAVRAAPFKLYSDKPGLFKRAGADIH
jgi:2'-5' RNA ligase